MLAGIVMSIYAIHEQLIAEVVLIINDWDTLQWAALPFYVPAAIWLFNMLSLVAAGDGWGRKFLEWFYSLMPITFKTVVSGGVISVVIILVVALFRVMF